MMLLRWLRRHRVAARRSGPRTVAELVELRMGAGSTTPEVVAAPAETLPDDDAPADEPVEEPVEGNRYDADDPAPMVAPTSTSEDQGTPWPRDDGGDTPWARGARMTGRGARRAAGTDVDRPAAGPADDPVAEHTAGEDAAVDTALLRTFGVAPAGDRPGSAPVVALSSAGRHGCPPAAADSTVPVTVRVLGRAGDPVAGASAALVDAHGIQVATAVTGRDGTAVLLAPVRASYMAVASAQRHQPGAVEVAVEDGPADAVVPLVGSSSVAGSVRDGGETMSGARVTLLQDGEIVEATESGGDGGFRFADLATGRYTLSVTAADHEQRVEPLEVPVATDVHHDLDLATSTLVGTSPWGSTAH
ncbi:MAG: carboxypeptidase regulatory-like domain-containing protein [Pseudonocardia sp.]|nr:carboxypeptidase regulatory-like domain-containing protein [Pseudonocardia sp.]